MSVLQKESTPFPRKRQPSAEGGEDVKDSTRYASIYGVSIRLTAFLPALTAYHDAHQQSGK